MQQPEQVYTDAAGNSIRGTLVQQSQNSGLVMSEPAGTRVNVTNPFTDTRHPRHPDHSKDYIAQPFDQQYQDNSYTYTLQQPIVEPQMHQPHTLQN